jgi:hypothetical protein
MREIVPSAPCAALPVFPEDARLTPAVFSYKRSMDRRDPVGHHVLVSGATATNVRRRRSRLVTAARRRPSLRATLAYTRGRSAARLSGVRPRTRSTKPLHAARDARYILQL